MWFNKTMLSNDYTVIGKILRKPQTGSILINIMGEGIGGARGIMVIVVGNGHGDTSSNPGQDWLHFK